MPPGYWRSLYKGGEPVTMSVKLGVVQNLIRSQKFHCGKVSGDSEFPSTVHLNDGFGIRTFDFVF